MEASLGVASTVETPLAPIRTPLFATRKLDQIKNTVLKDLCKEEIEDALTSRGMVVTTNDVENVDMLATCIMEDDTEEDDSIQEVIDTVLNDAEDNDVRSALFARGVDPTDSRAMNIQILATLMVSEK